MDLLSRDDTPDETRDKQSPTPPSIAEEHRTKGPARARRGRRTVDESNRLNKEFLDLGDPLLSRKLSRRHVVALLKRVNPTSGWTARILNKRIAWAKDKLKTKPVWDEKAKSLNALIFAALHEECAAAGWAVTFANLPKPEPTEGSQQWTKGDVRVVLNFLRENYPEAGWSANCLAIDDSETVRKPPSTGSVPPSEK